MPETRELPRELEVTTIKVVSRTGLKPSEKPNRIRYNLQSPVLEVEIAS